MTRPAIHRRGAWPALLAAALVAASPAPTAAQSAFTSLTFFGDSYVDTGNLLQLSQGTQPPSPPYAPGRLSNGPLWVDYFAPRFGRAGDAAPVFVARAASGNYAVAGARTTGGATSTAAQIGSYLTRPGATPATVTDPTGLYALFAGGNDLRDAGGISDPAARRAATEAAALRIVAQADQLAGAGARSLLLFTFPSLGPTPEARATPGRSAVLDEVAGIFAATLATGLAGLQTTRPTTTFYNLRLDNLFANLLADVQAGGTQYGFTNATIPCLQPGAPSCDVSIFADNLHATTRTHGLISDAAYTYVTTGQNIALVPEPATLGLVGAGLVLVFGVGAARRRAA